MSKGVKTSGNRLLDMVKKGDDITDELRGKTIDGLRDLDIWMQSKISEALKDHTELIKTKKKKPGGFESSQEAHRIQMEILNKIRDAIIKAIDVRKSGKEPSCY